MIHRVAVIYMALACSGCGAIRNAVLGGAGSINTPTASVIGVKDAGKPATIDSSTAGEVLEIPKGTTVVITKTEAIPATTSTKFVPAVEKVQYWFDSPTTWKKNDTKVMASTGVVDTTIATRKIEAEQSKPLLYAAIASMVGVAVFMYLHYPTPAYVCGGSSVVFFMAWKLSDLPDWFWALGAIGVAIAAALYFGHEKGEKVNSISK